MGAQVPSWPWATATTGCGPFPSTAHGNGPQTCPGGSGRVFVDAPHMRPGHGGERGVGAAEQPAHPVASLLRASEQVAGVRGLDIGGAGDGGQDPLRVGPVAVEDEQPPRPFVPGGAGMMGSTGDPS